MEKWRSDDIAAVPLRNGHTARARLRRIEPGAVILQGGLVVVVLLMAADLASNIATNMARLKLHVGFGFLGQPAGFDIAQSLIAFPASATYLRAFWVALLNTVLISAVAIMGATLVGLIVALARFSSNPLLALLARAYVEAGRNIPLLLQLFFWYFAVLGPLPLPRAKSPALRRGVPEQARAVPAGACSAGGLADVRGCCRDRGRCSVSANPLGAPATVVDRPVQSRLLDGRGRERGSSRSGRLVLRPIRWMCRKSVHSTCWVGFPSFPSSSLWLRA